MISCWILTCMSSDVNVQQRWSVKALFAVWTLEISRSRFLSEMSPQMHSKVVDARELFGANFTRKFVLLKCSWIATCMNQMSLKMIFSGECFITSWALNWLFWSFIRFFFLHSSLVRLSWWFSWFNFHFFVIILRLLQNRCQVFFILFNPVFNCYSVGLNGALMLCIILEWITIWLLPAAFTFKLLLTSVVSNEQWQDRHRNKGFSRTDTAKTSVFSTVSFFKRVRFVCIGGSTWVSAVLFLDPLGRPISNQVTKVKKCKQCNNFDF